MKKVIKNLESQLELVGHQLELVGQKIEQMEITFDERTEAWQESEKGELWRERLYPDGIYRGLTLKTINLWKN